MSSERLHFDAPEWVTAARARAESTDIAQAILLADPDQVDQELWLPDLSESREWLPDELLIRKIHHEIIGALKAFDLQRDECSLVISPRDWYSLKLGGCTRLFGMPASQWEGTSKPLIEFNGTYFPSARV